MPTAHLIDELIFDCSLDSTVIASNHESALSAWVSDGLLPAIDGVLNEFDEAGALWCLDCVEIDLGDVSSDNFYAELVQRVQDKLREKLRIARQNCLLPDFESIEPLPVRRLNNIQRDLEKLHVFLLTGNMPWHVDTKDAQVHEKILRNVLQEAGTSLISLARRLSVADRALFIKRLASQFPKHHLENVLIRIAPTQADWILDFLCVYQSAILNTDFIPSVHAELGNSVWEQLFAFFLEENQDGDHPTQSLSKLVKRLSLTQKQDPNLLMSKMAQAAERSMREGQIKGALVTAFQALTSDMPAISVQNQASEEALALDTQAAAIADTRHRQGAGEPLHLRILTAFHEAGLIAAKADSRADATQAGIDQLTQHLRGLIRSPEQLAQWVNRLAQPVLLDITYLLSASAAVLIEQLLAQSEILYRQPVSARRDTEAQWKQQLWCASLNYLLAEPSPDTEPGVYMQALARGMSGEAQLLPTLRAWCAALEQKKAYGTIHTLLHILTIDLPASEEQVEGERVDVPATPLKESTAYQVLHRRLSAKHSSAHQPDIRHLLQALAAEDALQLQRIYQDVGRNRYDLAAARLNPAELLGLIELWLRTESAMASDDERTFLQAVEAHASQLTEASHLPGYYRQVLADLLQAREIDLEMIALQVQTMMLHSGVDNDDRREETKLEESKAIADVETRKAEILSKSADNTHSQQVTQSTLVGAQKPRAGYESLHLRILTALHEAGLIAAQADFRADATQAGIDQLTQHLRGLIRSPEQLAQWVNRLAQPVLLDITYLLSASAAVLIEQLLAQSEILYRQPVSARRATKAQWKQQLWCASLNYLLAEPSPDTEPGAYMQALARGMSGEAQLLPTLRAWCAALEQKKAYGTIHTLLHTLTIDMPASEQVEGGRIDVPATPLKESTAYQALHRRLSAKHSSAHQPDIRHLLQALAAEDALQLQRIYQDVGRNRYDLAAARLNPAELLGLIELWLRTESAMASDDERTFLQAVEAHASQLTEASHLSGYYRQVLADLLQAREIDLEMIALQVQASVVPFDMSNDDQRKDAKLIATQESGGVEVETVEGSGKHAETANLLPITPSALAGAQKSQAVYGPWYWRILAALRDAGLAEEFKDVAMDSPQADIERFKQHLRTMLRTAQQRARLVDKLPPSILLDFTYLLAPLAAALIEQMQAQAETLYRQPASLHRVTEAQWKQQLWIASLDYLLAELHPHIEPVTYIRALACGISGEAQLLPTLRAWCAALEQKKAYGTLHKLLQTLIDSETGRSPTKAGASLPIDLRGLLMKVPSMEILEEIYIHNAGQVLAAPYLPRLFTMLSLVEDGVFIDRRATERAVHLLQFMVNEQTQTPEYQLTLNKVLCGITTGIPIDNRIDISAHEKKTIEGLMLGMIQNWKTIGNTSISGLRQTFLQRKGRLLLKEDGMWYLTIEPGTFDMLLDSLPWSYSVIKHAWMERAIHVTWR